MSFQELVNRFPQVDRAVLAAAYDAGLHDAYELLRAKGDDLGKEHASQVLLIDDLAVQILKLRVAGANESSKDRSCPP